MSTLLLRLAAPMQAWGCDSKFETRRTGREPTKSGIVGLLAAALGRKRGDSLDDLNRLHFGVRVDKEGELLYDYHTVQMSDGKTYVTHRYYLADATFVVGVESDDEQKLEILMTALQHPVFPLYLGRRACVPTLPVVLGIRSENLIESLNKEPWQLSNWMQKKEQKKGIRFLRIIADTQADDVEAVAQKDLPVSFHYANREYLFRPVKEYQPVLIKENEFFQETTHDAMAEM